MGKTSKCVVIGMKGIGKTTLLEHLIYGNIDGQDNYPHPTIEDIYAAVVETDRGTKEMMRFYDTEGFSLNDSNASEIVLPKHYHSLADAFVLVYSTEIRQSFEVADLLKKDIERNKEKKEVMIIVVGVSRKISSKREVDPSFAVSWAAREKLRHFDVNLSERQTLLPPFIYLSSKLNPPPAKSTFAPLGIRKTKE